jgi:cytochrome c556
MHNLDEEEITLEKIFEKFSAAFHHPEMLHFMKALEDPLKGETLADMLEIIKKTRAKLSEKLDTMYEQTHLSKDRVDKYIENPDNFSRKEWEAMAEFKEKIQDYVKEFQVASQGAGIREIVLEGRKRAQRKKSKLERYNSSNKKWIPMS